MAPSNFDKINPKNWSKKTRIIALITVIILALASTGLAVVYSHYLHERNCATQKQVFEDKKTELNQASQEAKKALASVDASLKEGEATRLAHTDGFPTSQEGQKAINELNTALNKATSHQDDQTPVCPSAKDNEARDSDLNDLKSQTMSFITTRDAYRLNKATEEANSTMDAAKSNLAQAQKDAAEQIAAVDADSQMQSDGNIKGAYDALKSVEGESHTLSTTVTVTSYDEAVASIEKAKTVDQKATDIKNAQESLKNAVNAYQEAKAAEAAAAARSAQQSASSNGGSARSYGSTGGSQSRSYSGGGSSSSGNSGSGSSQTQGGSTADEWAEKHGITKEEVDKGHYSYCVIAGHGRYFCS